MPVYDLVCPTCKTHEEKILKSHETPYECPNCQTPMQKLVGAPAFILKGVGCVSNGSFARAKDGPKIPDYISSMSDVELNRSLGLPDDH